ncbi:MAG TPA: type II toxin-antitoxin system HicB family antitoxin [Candidatus Kapabacteria bacterium]|jgi:predicted RNase H-like HicB family nuclease|nr:type II toxin-antitoxin system HicB family antitoxin [Candidatus Kapabacteria bacterium]
MKYQVKVKKTEEGVAVWCPDLPGCASQGATEEEALENIREAIHDYLEVQQELNSEVETRLIEVV